MPITTKCQISGLSFQVSDSAGSFANPAFAKLFPKQWLHPIFSISPSASLNLLKLATENPTSFSDAEIYLTCLSCITNTGLVTFDSPFDVTPQTIDGVQLTVASTCYRHLGKLMKAVTYINCLPTTLREKVPHFNISHSMSFLTFLPTFLECIFEFEIDLVTNDERARLARAEKLAELSVKKSLERFGEDTVQTAQKLADWAAAAGSFPTTLMRNPLKPNSTVQITLAAYWKELIIRCVNDYKIFEVNSDDLAELIQYCQDYLEHGDYMFHKLMRLLSRGEERAQSFLGTGDVDFNRANKTFAIVPEETSKESALLVTMILSAPDTKPEPANYPNKFDYLKACNRWKVKQEFLASGETLETLADKKHTIAQVNTTVDDL